MHEIVNEDTFRLLFASYSNSVAVQILPSVMQAMHLDLDAVVDVWEEAGRIPIEPVRPKGL